MQANPPVVLNPMSPMAWLPPDVAYQSTIAGYIVVGVAGALVWDILINIGSDYKLLFKNKLTFTTAVYFLSRESVLIFVLLNTAFQTSPLEDCQTIQRTINALNHLASCSTALLFYLRIWTIFDGKYYVIGPFFVLWLSVLGGTVAVALAASRAAFIGPTNYCGYGLIMIYASVAPITFAFNNTFLLLAAPWKLLPNPPNNINAKFSLGFNHHLSLLSKACFYDGQAYYTIAVLCNWAIVIATIIERGRVPAYWFTFTVFNLAVTNMMVCRVHRRLNVSDFRGDSMNTTRVMSRGGNDDGSLRFTRSITVDLNLGPPGNVDSEEIKTSTFEVQPPNDIFPAEKTQISRDVHLVV